MTALEAIEILKTDMGCYECTFGCSAPYECANGSCVFREAIHLAVERLSIDILPKMIKTEQTMSDDLIKRSDAIEAAKAFWYKPDIAGALAELPTIEPKRGEWIEDGGIEKCNQCGERKEFPHWNFCPNCGADMRGESRDTVESL